MTESTILLIATDYLTFWMAFLGFWIMFYWIKRMIFD